MRLFTHPRGHAPEKKPEPLELCLFWAHVGAAVCHLGQLAAFCTQAARGIFSMRRNVFLQKYDFEFQRVGHIQVEWLVVSAFALALASECHTLLFWDGYLRRLNKKFRSSWRWVEAATFLSVMFMAIGATLGFSIISDYVILSGMVITAMFVVWIGENWNADRFSRAIITDPDVDPRVNAVLLPLVVSGILWTTLWIWAMLATFSSTNSASNFRISMAIVPFMLLIIWTGQMYMFHNQCMDCFYWRGNQQSRARRMFQVQEMWTTVFFVVFLSASGWLVYGS